MCVCLLERMRHMKKESTKKGIAVTKRIREAIPPFFYVVGMWPALKLAGCIWMYGAAYVRIYPSDLFDSFMSMTLCFTLGYLASWVNDMVDLHHAKAAFGKTQAHSDLFLAGTNPSEESKEKK